VLPALIESIKAKMQGVVVGDPLESATHIGPLCTCAQVEKIEATLAKAKEQGANIHLGGERALTESGGNYFNPTIVECPDGEVETL